MKNALLIGAAGGIGSAILEEMYAKGEYNIIATSTREEALAQLKQDFEKIGTVAFDHTSRCEKELIAQVSEQFSSMTNGNGNIDVIVIASGMTSDSFCMRLSDELWDKTIEVNLSSSFRVIKHAYRKMNAGGAIILISSVVARMGNIGQVAYAASKGGVESMVKTLAREFAAKEITVNAIAPGFIATKMTQAFDEQELAKSIPLNRFGKAEEIAYATEFLASQKARYITGHTLEINGGMWMV